MGKALRAFYNGLSWLKFVTFSSWVTTHHHQPLAIREVCEDTDSKEIIPQYLQDRILLGAGRKAMVWEKTVKGEWMLGDRAAPLGFGYVP